MSASHESIEHAGRRRPWWRALLVPLALLSGATALVWFLVRVIPKPSRASYPCMRASAPLASGFVLWLLSLLGSATAFRRARWARLTNRPWLAICCSAVGLLAVVGILLWVPALRASSRPPPPFVPGSAPNAPIGVGRGVHPGRVVWVHDPAATTWDGVTGHWWDAANTDSARVDAMLSDAIRWLTSEAVDAVAWDALFRAFNQRRGRGEVGYREGEKIAIKLNLNCSASRSWQNNNGQNTTPKLVYALLAQLVHEAGVRPEDITLADPSRILGDPIYNLCQPAFPGVRFVDRDGGNGRVAAVPDMTAPVFHGDPAVSFHGERYIAGCFTEATYLINLALLRGHNLAGVTLSAKNHFGSTWVDRVESWHGGWFPGGPAGDTMGGMHGYITAYDYNWPGSGEWSFQQRSMGSYTPLVDLMGHRELGEKTVLFLVDALYAAVNQSNARPVKWSLSPFDNHWTASLLLSQDAVALDSVGLDFLRSEAQYADTVYGTSDNYLHEAAQAHDPPSGTFYDPEGDGIRLSSLGVHEIWNNPQDKQYSRDLAVGLGIELVRTDPLATLPFRLELPLAAAMGSVTLRWEGVIGMDYRLDYRTDLSGGEGWKPVAGAEQIRADRRDMSWELPPMPPRVFFRVLRSFPAPAEG